MSQHNNSLSAFDVALWQTNQLNVNRITRKGHIPQDYTSLS